MGLEERTRSEQCRHRKPDPECNTLKNSVGNPVSRWVKRQLRWRAEAEAPAFFFFFSTGSTARSSNSIYFWLISVKAAVWDALLVLICAQGVIRQRTWTAAGPMWRHCQLPLISVFLRVRRWTCMQVFFLSHHSNKSFERSFIRVKLRNAAFPPWTSKMTHKQTTFVQNDKSSITTTTIQIGIVINTMQLQFFLFRHL